MRKFPFFSIHLSLTLHQCGAGAHNPFPGLMVLLVADPDIEVCASPGARRQPVQFFGRDAVTSLRESHRLEPRLLPDSVVDKAQKVTTAVGVVIPGILS